MITETTPAIAVPETSPGYPGWRIVAACFLLAVFSWALGFYGQGVYLASLHRLHGWAVADISGAATLYYLVSAGLIVFVGDAIARFGARAFLIAGVLTMTVATILIGHADSLPLLYAAYVLLAFGWAATSVVAISTVIGGWFETKRGLAISLALNGASVGGILGAPALVAAVDSFGFATALLGAGLLAALVLVPMILLVIRSPTAAQPRSPGAGASPLPSDNARRRAMQQPAFWTMTLAFAAALFVQAGFVVHQVAFMEPRVGAQAAGFAVSVTAVAATLGRLALGIVVDRVNQRLVSARSVTSQAVALVLALNASSPALLFAASALFGLSVGNVITLPSLIIHREYPAAAFAAIVGLSTAIGQVVYAFGPGVIGTLRDLSGGYGVPLALCAAIDAAAAIVVLVSGRATRPT